MQIIKPLIITASVLSFSVHEPSIGMEEGKSKSNKTQEVLSKSYKGTILERLKLEKKEFEKWVNQFLNKQNIKQVVAAIEKIMIEDAKFLNRSEAENLISLNMKACNFGITIVNEDVKKSNSKQLKENLDEVKKASDDLMEDWVMMEDDEKKPGIVKRGEKINKLSEKSEELANTSNNFLQTAKKLSEKLKAQGEEESFMGICKNIGAQLKGLFNKKETEEKKEEKK